MIIFSASISCVLIVNRLIEGIYPLCPRRKETRNEVLSLEILIQLYTDYLQDGMFCL